MPSIFCTTTAVFSSIVSQCTSRLLRTATITEKRICPTASLNSTLVTFRPKCQVKSLSRRHPTPFTPSSVFEMGTKISTPIPQFCANVIA